MNRPLAVILLLHLPAAAAAQTVRVGPLLGASLLTKRDTSLSHATLTDEVTAGPTVLFGLLGEVALGSENRLTFELTLGPYHNDVQRSCTVRQDEPPGTCTPEPFRSVSRALVWGMQYAHRFGDGGWRPYLSGGFAVRTQWITFNPVPEELAERSSRAAVGLALGVELARGKPFRLEARGQFNLENPLFVPDRTHFELQLRAAFLLPVR
jgi:hypothetical protein